MLLDAVNVQVLSMVPVSKVTVTLPVDVTASENVTSMSMTSPTPYVPFVLSDEMFVMVGGVVSGQTDVLKVWSVSLVVFAKASVEITL